MDALLVTCLPCELTLAPTAAMARSALLCSARLGSARLGSAQLKTREERRPICQGGNGQAERVMGASSRCQGMFAQRSSK